MAETDFLRAAFASITRELPGRYNRLRTVLDSAPVEVQREFYELVRCFEDQIEETERKAQWRRW